MYSQTVNVSGFSHTGSAALSVTDSSSSVAISFPGSTVIVRNYGPNRAYVKLGNGSPVATTSDYPIEAYTVDYMNRSAVEHDKIAAICANSGETASLSINCGEGGA